MYPTTFADAPRVMTNVLASVERRCLRWLAVRLPSRISSDHLTALALCSMIGTGVFFYAARFNRWWLAAVVAALAVNWFGDSLDGTVARVRGQQRPRYGFYVDHVVDCVGLLFLFAGLAASGFMTPLIGAGVLVAYLLLSIDVYLATYCLREFKLSFWGVGPTELRLVLAAGAIALANDPRVELFGRQYLLFDVGGAVAIACLTMTAVVSICRNVRTLYRAEPLPPVSR